MPGKNGKIQLLRIVFCLAVILFHIGKDLPSWQAFAVHGYIGVEFFFLVTGVLMGKSLAKTRDQEMLSGAAGSGSVTGNSGNSGTQISDLGTESAKFLWKKIKAVLPYHFLFYGLMFLVYAANGRQYSLTYLLDKLPGLFFLHYLGFHGSNGTGTILGLEWYLCSMFLAIAIIYPLARKFGRAFTRWAAPIIGLLILCYMMMARGQLSGSDIWDTVIWHPHLRAIAEICIGLACYEAAAEIARRGQSTPRSGNAVPGTPSAPGFRLWQRLLLTLIEWGCYAAVIAYVFSSLSVVYEIHMFSLLAVGLTISFSGQSLLGNSRIFNNNICYFLGDISLPVYLGQNVARRLLIPRLPGLGTPQLVLIIVICDLVIGAAAFLAWRAVSSRYAAWAEARASKS